MNSRLSSLRLLACLAGIVLAGCGRMGDLPRPGSPQQAEAVAARWLEAVQSGIGDRGWAHVHPLAKERWFANSQVRYQHAVESVDWHDFRWRIESSARRDGNDRVGIVIEGDASPAREFADGQLIQVFPPDDGVTRALMTVLMESSGLAGVL